MIHRTGILQLLMAWAVAWPIIAAADGKNPAAVLSEAE